MSKKLFVGNLPHAATEAEVEAAFAAHGEVIAVNIVTDRETGRSRGFAFVEMDDAGAAAAKQALNGVELGGRAMRIDDAKPRQSPPTRR